MSILGRLFGRKLPNTPTKAEPAAAVWAEQAGPPGAYWLDCNGAYDQDVAGESYHLAELMRITGGASGELDLRTTAQLVPEPKNRHDKNAIRVEIAGRLVGYLPRDAAVAFHRQLAAQIKAKTPIMCHARVRRSERGFFGVYLEAGLSEYDSTQDDDG